MGPKHGEQTVQSGNLQYPSPDHLVLILLPVASLHSVPHPHRLLQYRLPVEHHGPHPGPGQPRLHRHLLLSERHPGHPAVPTADLRVRHPGHLVQSLLLLANVRRNRSLSAEHLPDNLGDALLLHHVHVLADHVHECILRADAQYEPDEAAPVHILHHHKADGGGSI